MSPANAAAGWSHVGFVQDLCLQRHKVLEDRFAEVFQSKRSGAGNISTPKSKASAALDLLAVVSPAKMRCGKENCKAMVAVTDRFCSRCGWPNDNFDKETDKLFHCGRKPGWHKPLQPEIVPETDFERHLATGVGDLMATLRRTSQAKLSKPEVEAATAKPEVEAPAASQPATPGTKSARAPATPAPAPAPATPAPKKGETTGHEDAREFDLSRVDDCVDWLAAAFSVERRDEVLPVCRFFVEENLRPKVTKTTPLSAVFKSQVLSPGVLKQKAARDAWLKFWRAERSKRFVPPPAEYWKK